MTSQEQEHYDEALEGACLFEALQNTRGVHPLKTAAACAMLIGRIIGTAAADETHVQEGLEHLIRIMNLTAADWLAAHQQVKH